MRALLFLLLLAACATAPADPPEIQALFALASEPVLERVEIPGNPNLVRFIFSGPIEDRHVEGAWVAAEGDTVRANPTGDIYENMYTLWTGGWDPESQLTAQAGGTYVCSPEPCEDPARRLTIRDVSAWADLYKDPKQVTWDTPWGHETLSNRAIELWIDLDKVRIMETTASQDTVIWYLLNTVTWSDAWAYLDSLREARSELP